MFRSKISQFNPSFLDLFGYKPSLRVNKESNSYTFLGLLFSLMLGGLLLFVLIYNGSELYLKESPNVTSTRLKRASLNDKLTVTQYASKILFAMTRGPNSQVYYDTTVYFVIPEKKDQTAGSTPLDFGICQGQMYDQTTNALCLDEQQSRLSELTITHKDDSMITVALARCDTLLQLGLIPGPCKSTAQIDAILSGSEFVIAIDSWQIDPLNHKEPLQPYRETASFSVVSKYAKKISLDLIPVEFTSDEGLLLEDKQTTKFFNLDKIETEIYDFSVDLTFMKFILANGGDKEIHTRSYLKITDLFAKVFNLFKPPREAA